MLHKPFKAKLLLTQYKNEDTDFKNTVIDIVMYLVSGYEYDLDTEQKKAIIFLSKIISNHFSKEKRHTPQERINELENVLNEREEEYIITIESKDKTLEFRNETIESQNIEIESLKKEIESQNLRIAQLEKDQLNKGLTISQQNIFYYYMFNGLGINFENSKKIDWAKLISTLNGKNEVNIRKALSIKFEDSATKKDMRLVASIINDLFPNITQKILNDCE